MEGWRTEWGDGILGRPDATPGRRSHAIRAVFWGRGCPVMRMGEGRDAGHPFAEGACAGGLSVGDGMRPRVSGGYPSMPGFGMWRCLKASCLAA